MKDVRSQGTGPLRTSWRGSSDAEFRSYCCEKLMVSKIMLCPHGQGRLRQCGQGGREVNFRLFLWKVSYFVYIFKAREVMLIVLPHLR